MLQSTYILTGALNLTHEEFHSRVSPTAISNVACVSTENELTDCSYSPLTSCDPLNDAGVVCQGRNCKIAIFSDIDF